YCMGAMQGAVCVPSRAMLLSGRSLFRINDQIKDIDTWPEAYARAGYKTFISGKWHNGPQSVARMFQEGRAIYLGGMTTDPFAAKVVDIESAGKLSAPRDAGKHTVEAFSDSAIEFLKQQKKGAPFLCYVAFNAPHDPRVAPKP